MLRPNSTDSGVSGEALLLFTMKHKKCCRVCLTDLTSSESDIFVGDNPIYLRLEVATGLKIKKTDRLPHRICNGCLNDLNTVCEFQKKFQKSDQILQQYLKCEEIKEEIEDDSISLDDSKSHTDSCEDFVIDSESFKDVGGARKKLKIKKESVQTDFHISKILPSEKENEQKFDVKTDIRNEENLNDNCKNRKHMCATCGKTFLYHGNLVDHERVHSGAKPFECNICNQKFSQSGHLLVHKRIHSGVKPYQCDICAKCFTVSHSLKKHLRTHTGEKPHTCIICNKCFSTSYHLSSHCKTHSDEKVYKCKWIECQANFFTKHEMNMHEAIHGSASLLELSSNNVKVLSA